MFVDGGSARPDKLPALPSDGIIAITGGGNFGDIYEGHLRLRHSLMRNYRRNRIVQLPQSIYFQDSKNTDELSEAIRQHGDVHLLVRDLHSLSVARQLNPGVNVLCPDMAMYLGALHRTHNPKHPIGALIRQDRESSLQQPRTTRNLPVRDWTGGDKMLKKSIKLVT